MSDRLGLAGRGFEGRGFEGRGFEGLGHYVYSLTDPRTGRLFYIGRGHGDRAYQHGREALRNPHPTDRLEIIRAIQQCGLDPVIDIIRHGLTPQASEEVEAALIDFALHRYDGLANLVRGTHVDRGLTSLGTFLSDHAAWPLEVPDQPVLLVSIGRSWIDGMDSSALWEAARKWWHARRIMPGCEFLLLAAAAGIVRGAWAARHEWDGLVTWDMLDDRRRMIYGETEERFRPFPARCFTGQPVPVEEARLLVGRHLRHDAVRLRGPFRYLGRWPLATLALQPDEMLLA
ncbi:hypothetical protein NON00_24115 [Roseomonas sp. GC11]|uniref:LEM-3-like GIY-YIG domain-containing protein n=1 Tax=Roseomonas sp. GC11 TaxID=2950546 RepID=UPI00210A9FD0|nr:hypothetical protein [Roseomonas sp. GC11]MCQ4162985.1 hypothetical protein [Roseomonas sp. GC11]